MLKLPKKYYTIHIKIMIAPRKNGGISKWELIFTEVSKISRKKIIREFVS